VAIPLAIAARSTAAILVAYVPSEAARFTPVVQFAWFCVGLALKRTFGASVFFCHF